MIIFKFADLDETSGKVRGLTVKFTLGEICSIVLVYRCFQKVLWGIWYMISML
jgi:hypothetical protein